MYESGADEQLICEKTGHRSVAVHSYKCTSNNQLHKITDMLYGNQEIATKKPKIENKAEPASTVSKPPPSQNHSPETHVAKSDSKESNENGKAMCHSVDLGKGLVMDININVAK